MRLQSCHIYIRYMFLEMCFTLYLQALCSGELSEDIQTDFFLKSLESLQHICM